MLDENLPFVARGNTHVEPLEIFGENTTGAAMDIFSSNSSRLKIALGTEVRSNELACAIRDASNVLLTT